MSEITFRDIRNLKKLKLDREKQIQNGEVTEGFSIVQKGSLGCVFYSKGSTHTFTYVLVVNEVYLITIPLMFSTSVNRLYKSIDTLHIKEMFANWANVNGYSIEHLLLNYRWRDFDPENEVSI